MSKNFLESFEEDEEKFLESMSSNKSMNNNNHISNNKEYNNDYSLVNKLCGFDNLDIEYDEYHSNKLPTFEELNELSSNLYTVDVLTYLKRR